MRILWCVCCIGEYGVEFYANDPSRDGDTFTHMAQYLLAWQLPTGTTTPEGFRDMYNFENYAPSLGQVPLPYATDQYQPGSAAVRSLLTTSIFEANSCEDCTVRETRHAVN